MEIKTKTTDYEFTPDVERYLGEKLGAVQKLLSGDNEARCEVTLGRAVSSAKHGEVWFVDCSVIPTTGDRVHAYARAETITAAIDKAKDEVLQQLRKGKNLHIRMLRKGGAAIKKMMRWE